VLQHVLLSCVACVMAVDRSKFRTCKQTGFCSRYRDIDHQISDYSLLGSFGNEEGSMVARVGKTGEEELKLTIKAIDSGVLRLRIDEIQSFRWAPSDVLIKDIKTETLRVEKQDNDFVFLRSNTVYVRVQRKPLRVDVLTDTGDIFATINQKGLLHYEQQNNVVSRKTSDSPGEEIPEDTREVLDWGEDGKPIYADGSVEEAVKETELASTATEAPESFGGHTDNKPHGLMSIGVDVTFPGAKHMFGVPEHATDFSLKSTKGSGGYDEPFRMYNLDVFEYEIDVPMALYGHIPVAIAHKAGQTSGVFWNNPSETFVDITNDPQDGSKNVRWISETGVFDLMIMTGPSPSQVFKQYSSLTGTAPLPPMASLGYHQCRWNYRDEKDVEEVNAGFEEHDLPYDMLWLDIEHTDGKRYFTWDKHKFPNPLEMQKNIAHFGRKMVTIVDPHIKRDDHYYIHKEATQLGYYVKDKNGADFKGWCWPGDSSYLDFTDGKVRSWWADQFAFDKYIGSSDILYTWNDMNEPSVFNGPEVSMSKEALSIQGIEHREWHNLYGFYQQMATAEGLTRRSSPAKRPFVLSRAFFAGTQRVGAIWTGDNSAEWSHLAIASHMLLSMNVAGLSFVGADIGGFFNNPSEELLVRWYFAAAFQPFFRGHSHLDTKRREPWVFGPVVLAQISKAIKLRYSLLPYWYTVFHQHELTGLPVMCPLWSLAPDDEATFSIGDQWLIGQELLVKPVVTEGGTSVDVYFPKGYEWFSFDEPHTKYSGGQTMMIDAPIGFIPVFIRSGVIIPRKMRVRRSSKPMENDPYTLVIAPNAQDNAHGLLYIDDELTFAYKQGEFCTVELKFNGGVVAAATNACSVKKDINVERVVLMGWKGSVSPTVTTSTGESLLYKIQGQTLTIRKPIDSFLKVPFSIIIN